MIEELDLIDEEDQITHEIGLLDQVDPERELGKLDFSLFNRFTVLKFSSHLYISRYTLLFSLDLLEGQYFFLP